MGVPDEQAAGPAAPKAPSPAPANAGAASPAAPAAPAVAKPKPVPSQRRAQMAAARRTGGGTVIKSAATGTAGVPHPTVAVAGDQAAAAHARPKPNRVTSMISRSDLGLQSKVERLELLHKIAKQFTMSLNLHDLMQKIFSEIITTLDAQAGSLWLIDAKKGDLVCEVADGPDGGSKIVGLRIPVGTGVVGWVAQKSKSTIVYDTTKDSRFSKTADRKTGFVTKSMICAPLKIGDTVIGAVQVINRRDENIPFTDSDLHMLEDIATYAAISIKNARAYEATKRVNELKAILDMSKEMTSSLDMDSVLVTCVNAAKQVIDYDRAIVAIEHNGKAKISAISGEAAIDASTPDNKVRLELLEFLLPRDAELWVPDTEEYLAQAEAASRGGAAWSADAAKPTEGAAPAPEVVKNYLKHFPSVKSFWARILKDEEGVLGIMVMEAERKNFMEASQLEIVTILTNQTSLALRNAQLYAKVPLVGIFSTFSNQTNWWKALPWWARITSAAVLVAAILVVFVIPNPWSSVGGELEVAAVSKHVMYSSIDGRLKTVAVREGQTVKKGDLLAAFDTDDLQLQLNAKSDDLEKKKLDLAARSGMPDPLLTRQYQRVEQEIKLIRQKLREATVLSPVDGIVMTPKPENLEGKVFHTGDEVVTVAALDTVRIDIFVGEEDIRYLEQTKQGGEPQKVTFKASAYREQTYSGSIAAISPTAVDRAGKKVITASVVVPNPIDETTGEPRLKPGMTGKAKVAIEPRTLFSAFLHALGMN
jgi:GAF domain-containing protein/multidrug efflux pump subunit AcrA (membrane-fusion protein)